MSKDSTRDRILAAASAEFSIKGFDKTTVRDICTRADVNVAAINYHFRDKQNLYYKVLAHWMDDYMEKTGLRESMTSLKSPEEKYRQYLRAELSYMCKANDPDGVQLNQARQIIQELSSEDHDPEVFRCHKEVEEEILFPVLQELLGGCEDMAVVADAAMAATSLSVHYFLRALDDPQFTIQTEEDLDHTTNFLATFALGGLKAIKEKYNA
ncbi:TetR/AcrR family transcriptional regulator [Pseudodesulfovibrio portus]|jgi:AcrR family transcriptional regulator|uniref:TetR family transcriptional regulator n=1 Tax=Pseudodesulfovibrio portus TaxID=231439 RepID=A0ABN6RVB0_9BACT|nr:TetR/AcrR family transcriptional regulator [Pseudodesulfovibrio portus]BDQ33833.1 TetR family transcriptional regulator [Pseudodesulfovibrio portus]